MRNALVILVSLYLVACGTSTEKFKESDLIGTWKIDKMETQSGEIIDGLGVQHHTFTYNTDHTVRYFTPEFIETLDSGIWELRDDSLCYLTDTDSVIYRQKVLALSKEKMILEQKEETASITIYLSKNNVK